MIETLSGHPPAALALLDARSGRSWTYGTLLEESDARADRLVAAAGGRGLAFLAATGTADSVILYLAALRAGLPLALVEPREEALARLAATYAPALLLLPRDLAVPKGYRLDGEAAERYGLWVGEPPRSCAIHPDLALLLTTSGSTGSPKLVRLSLRSLAANASAIAQYLGLGPAERAILSLPMHYSFGLSVVNSHLLAGGSLGLTPHSFLRPEFWEDVQALGCTSFAGVPYMYETLERLQFDPGRFPALRTLTQAGGGLRPDLVAHFHRLARKAGARFFVMYGQTEATARISYVPPDRLEDHPGSIGVPIPGGRLSLAPVEGMPGEQELVYEGPNVMLGYAEGPEDLAKGDELHGILKTGDLAAEDGEGQFRLVGRLTRFAKIFGHRVSLEDLEQDLESAFPAQVAVVEAGGGLRIVYEALAALDPASLKTRVVERLGVPPGAVRVQAVGALPRAASGKKDYRALQA